MGEQVIGEWSLGEIADHRAHLAHEQFRVQRRAGRRTKIGKIA